MLTADFINNRCKIIRTWQACYTAACYLNNMDYLRTMLTVSLHGITIVAPIGLYPEEKIHPNTFEVDVDVEVKTETDKPWPFVDYAQINDIVVNAFTPDIELLETLVANIHNHIKTQIADAMKVKVAVRKMAPPLQNNVRYSQVCYEG